MGSAWVADVGGTSVRIAVVSPNGEVIATRTHPTSDFAEPTTAWESMIESWRSLDPGQSPVGVAVSLPARIATNGVIEYIPNIPSWTGSNPVEVLREATGTPAHAVFDIRAALLGERWMGDAVPPTFYFMAIGTGIGGAFQVDGHVACGTHHLAGMPAMRLAGEGVWVEDIASGSALAEACGVASGQEALALAHAGDPPALSAFERASSALQEAIAIATVIVDASEVRIGGGFGTAAFDLLFPRTDLAPEYRSYPPVHDDLVIRRASTGSQAQILGLAATVFTDSCES